MHDAHASIVTQTKQQSAMALTRKGFRVFPCSPLAKDPACKWKAEATTDLDRASALWSGQLSDANIGIATGGGLVVVDVDMKNGRQGLQSLDALQHEFKEALPPTLMARTPSGGLHLYFSYPADQRAIGNRAGLRDGIDIRGAGGYVVAPPSELNNERDGTGKYTWVEATKPIAAAPNWLLDLIEKTTPADTQGAPITDGSRQILDALAFLSNHPPAIEGASGDAHTYATAVRLRDFGVSEDTAVHLLQTSGWNSRCSPPWDIDELHTKVANAYRYAKNAPGTASPEAHFADDEIVLRARAEIEANKRILAEEDKKKLTEALETIRPRPAVNRALKDIHARRRVLGDIALEGYLTVGVAPGGTGKSALTILMALAVATGRDDLMDMPVRPTAGGFPAGAWLFNNEDGWNELGLRIKAAMQHHNIAPDTLECDITGRPTLFVNSGEDAPFRITQRRVEGRGDRRTVIHAPVHADAAIAHIRANNIKLFIVDPFIETHDADENDNGQIAQVAHEYRRIAQEGECAVVLVHHTRKPAGASSAGHGGNQDSARGAGALMAMARVGWTVSSAPVDVAARVGVDAGDAWRLMALEGSKANLGPQTGEPAWFWRNSVTVRTDDGFDENVVALSRWQPLDEFLDGAGDDGPGGARALGAALRAVLVEAGEPVLARSCAQALREGVGCDGRFGASARAVQARITRLFGDDDDVAFIETPTGTIHRRRRGTNATSAFEYFVIDGRGGQNGASASSPRETGETFEDL